MTPTILPEQVLVDRARCGDWNAFNRLYEDHVALVAARVMRMMGPSSDVDDAVQEVFFEMHRSLRGFEGRSSFRTWLLGITRNVTLRFMRRSGRLVDLSALVHFRASNGEWERLSARERIRIVYAALEDVPPEQREPFLLHTFEGMSLREISELTGEPINTIAARVRRLRQRFHALVDRPATEPQARTAGGA